MRGLARVETHLTPSGMRMSDALPMDTTPLEAQSVDTTAVDSTRSSERRKPSVRAPKAGTSKVVKERPGTLPEELRESEEAVAVWAAAKLASYDCRAQSVHGWQITWRPRAAAKGKSGDMYIFPPRDSFSVGIGSVRSLANLRDALLSRKAARDDPSSVLFHPPPPGSLVEVLQASAGPDATGAIEEEPVWQQAQVLLVAPDRSFQVALRNERCVEDSLEPFPRARARLSLCSPRSTLEAPDSD